MFKKSFKIPIIRSDSPTRSPRVGGFAFETKIPIPFILKKKWI